MAVNEEQPVIRPDSSIKVGQTHAPAAVDLPERLRSLNERRVEHPVRDEEEEEEAAPLAAMIYKLAEAYR